MHVASSMPAVALYPLSHAPVHLLPCCVPLTHSHVPFPMAGGGAMALQLAHDEVLLQAVALVLVVPCSASHRLPLCAAGCVMVKLSWLKPHSPHSVAEHPVTCQLPVQLIGTDSWQGWLALQATPCCVVPLRASQA